MEEKTEDFYNAILPDVDRILYSPDVEYDTNDIILRVILQYGRVGSGKTGSAKSIVEKAVEKYGEDNVNAVISKDGNLRYTLSKGLDDQLVQVLILDDITLVDIPEYVVSDFFRIRHKWQEQEDVDHGLIIAVFNCHRYHTLDVNLRSNIDVIVWKSYPNSKYDRTHMKGYIGEEGLDILKDLEGRRLEMPELNALGVYSSPIGNGIVNLGLPIDDYTIDVYDKRFVI